MSVSKSRIGRHNLWLPTACRFVTRTYLTSCVILPFFATALEAKPVLTLLESKSACTLAYVGAIACQGYYGGNIDGATVSFQQAALAELLTSPTVGTANGGSAPAINWAKLTTGGALYSAQNLGKGENANNLYFGKTLYGLVIFGAHFGNNDDTTNPQNNVSAFYLFDFGLKGADRITFTPNASGFSNAVVYSSGSPPKPGPVPEPATWAMMLLGFGGIGVAMRRRRTQQFAHAT
jgi:hypothetical protein